MNTTAYERLVDDLHARGSKVVTRGHGQASAQCPAHEDRNPSLSLRAIEGMALVYCQAGCDTRDVLAALDRTLGDLYDEPRGVEYRYDNGRVVHRSPSKRFHQSGNLATVELYHLGRLRAAGPGAVYLVEGEKDVHAIEALGGVATTAPMGARNFGKVDVSPLNGRHVTAVVDRDDEGHAWAATVAARLAGVAAGVRFVEAATGKDAADHIAAGRTLDEFVSYETPAAPEPRPALEFLTLKELCSIVDSAGPRTWLLRGMWPQGDYGVHAGEMKAQKTWNVVDLVMAVATGTPWLGLVDVDLNGPVLMFTGEGGQANLVRRLRAVAQGLAIEDLPIVVCTRAPHLTDEVHRGLMADQLDAVRPVLTSIDPLYLAARGAKGSDLYAMGDMLEWPQHACQEVGSALIVTTHHNRGNGRGAGRITGAGPAEWGRVLINATVISRHVDTDTGGTTVITELDAIGGEIADATIRLVRRIHAESPELDAPLHYDVDATYVDRDAAAGQSAMPPARAKLLDALRAESAPVTVTELVDRVVTVHGHGLRRETCSRELNALLDAGLADRIDQGKGRAALWTAVATTDL